MMDGNKTIGPLALRRIGEALRRMCGISRKLPFRLHELVGLPRRATKQDDYLKLTRFRGHPNICVQGAHDGEDETTLHT